MCDEVSEMLPALDTISFYANRCQLKKRRGALWCREAWLFYMLVWGL